MNIWSAIFFGLAVYDLAMCIGYAMAKNNIGLTCYALSSGFCVFFALYKMIPN
jgi:hypothetical protein